MPATFADRSDWFPLTRKALDYGLGWEDLYAAHGVPRYYYFQVHAHLDRARRLRLAHRGAA